MVWMKWCSFYQRRQKNNNFEDNDFDHKVRREIKSWQDWVAKCLTKKLIIDHFRLRNGNNFIFSPPSPFFRFSIFIFLRDFFFIFCCDWGGNEPLWGRARFCVTIAKIYLFLRKKVARHHKSVCVAWRSGMRKTKGGGAWAKGPFLRHAREEGEMIKNELGNKVQVIGYRVKQCFAPGQKKVLSVWQSYKFFEGGSI